MSAQHPTPDDLRTVADNLWAEGQHSRAEVIYNAADRMELLELGADKLTPAFVAQVEAIKLARDFLIKWDNSSPGDLFDGMEVIDSLDALRAKLVALK